VLFGESYEPNGATVENNTLPLCYTADPESTFGSWTDNVAHVYEYESAGTVPGGPRTYANRVGVNPVRTPLDVQNLWRKQLIFYEGLGCHKNAWVDAWTACGNTRRLDPPGSPDSLAGQRVEDLMSCLRLLFPVRPSAFHNVAHLRMEPDYAESSSCAPTRGLVREMNQDASFGLMMSVSSSPRLWGEWLSRDCANFEFVLETVWVPPVVLGLSCGTNGIDMDNDNRRHSTVEKLLPLDRRGFSAHIGATRGFWQYYYYWYGEKWLAAQMHPERFPTIGDLHNHVRTELIAEHADDPNMPIFCDMMILVGNPILRLPGMNWDPHVGVAHNEGRTHFRLGSPRPSPFGSATVFPYALGERQAVTLHVYDIRGRLVRVLLSGEQEAGEHRIEWDGRDGRGRRAPAGLYFAKLRAGSESATREVTLIR